MLTVHVRINDAATGKPAPVRVRFLDPSGAPHAPLGRLAEFAVGPGEDLGGNVRVGPARFAYIDGACEVRLPAGKVIVEVHKGVEYVPLRREVVLGAGQISLRLAVERWADLRAEGWYAGDARAHELSPHAALLEGAAEDLAFVHLLARERPAEHGRPAAVSNLLAFSGTKAALEGQGCAVAVNTLNGHPVLGTVALLNCHRPVFPLRFGDPEGSDDWSVADWCDQCHRKSGLVTWPDLPRLTADCPQGEALAALLLGKVDAFEVCSFPEVEPPVLADWYRLLDCGCRLPLVGASGKDSNAVTLGRVRTCARLAPGQEPALGPWIEAVRAGRTFITNGPLLTLTAGGEGPGALIAAGVGKSVPVRAEARSAVPFDQVEILSGGTVVAAKTASGNRQSAVVEMELPVTASTWLAARCWSHERLPDGQCIYAHTSPVHIEVAGRPRPDAVTAGPLVEVLEHTRDWIARAARCPTEHHREHLAGIVEAGLQELLRRQAPGPRPGG
jgi:hypothetical protein